MIVEERMRTFINSLDTGNTPFLEELEKEALESEVPVIRREMQSFIKTLLAVQKPEHILEVGTAVGFSTLSKICNKVDFPEPDAPTIATNSPFCTDRSM